jgi:hypothetical protein
VCASAGAAGYRRRTDTAKEVLVLPGLDLDVVLQLQDRRPAVRLLELATAERVQVERADGVDRDP